MRAGLTGDVDAPGPGLGDEGHSRAAADVHHVQRAAGVGGQRDRPADRLEFRDHRPRGEIVADARAARRHRLTGQRRGERVVLGVHEHGQAEIRRHLHSPPERRVVDALKIIDPTPAHERLDADDAAVGELGQLAHVAGHETAPDAEVGSRHASGSRELRVERCGIERGGRGVERHVDKERASAGGDRCRAGRQALPVGPSRVVEVHMRVDQSR